MKWCLLGILIFCLQFAGAQVFPLKVNAEKAYLLTKSNSPFFVNASSAEIFPRGEDVINTLNSLSFKGVNTVLIVLDQADIQFNSKGAPEARLRRNVSMLKFLAREAAMKNMAVLVCPYDFALPEITEELNRQYHSYLFKKLGSYNNILWLLDQRGLGFAQSVNPKQLKGLFSPNSADSSLLYHFSVNGKFKCSSKPGIVLIKSSSTTDSIAYATRNLVYSAILNGASGVIYQNTQAEKFDKPRFTFNPIAYQLKHLTSLLDSLSWELFKPFPEIISQEENLKVPVSSIISNDSSKVLVYLPSSFTVPLNLSKFKHGIELNWMNPVTGKVYQSFAAPKPEQQLFLPPTSNEKFTDWLLIIMPRQNTPK